VFTIRNSKFSLIRKTLMVFTLALMMCLSMTSLIWADSVGTTGGTVSFASGDVTVEVPSAAISEDIEITYSALDITSAPGAAPEGKTFGSQIFELGVTKGGEAQSLYSFSRLVGVTVKYSDADLAQAYNGRGDHINLYLWDANFGVWNLDVAASRDPVNNTLTSRQEVLVPIAVVVSSASILAPSTGDYGVSNSLLALLLVVGLLSIFGGSYLLSRGRNQGLA
jgi:hypothetical protein